MSGVTQEAVDAAIHYLNHLGTGKTAHLIEQLWTDYLRLTARCQRLEQELMATRVLYQSVCERLN